MHKALCALSLLLCSGAACAQTVTDQSVGGLMFVTDSSGEILEATFPVIDPTVAPAGLSLLVENDEPLSSFNPTYHTVSLDADLDSTGSNWSGSGTSAAHYADALDLSVDYGGSNIPAATAIFSHNVYFTVDFPTTVDVNTNFLIQMTDTFNPVFFANNFRLQFRDSNNNTVYSTGFDNTQLGVPQHHVQGSSQLVCHAPHGPLPGRRPEHVQHLQPIELVHAGHDAKLGPRPQNPKEELARRVKRPNM